MRRFLIIVAAVVLSACSTMEGMMGSAPAAPTKTADGVLTNSAGMTLYTFDKDAMGSGKSARAFSPGGTTTTSPRETRTHPL